MNGIKHLATLSQYWSPDRNKGELWWLYEMLCVKGMSREEASEIFRDEGKSPSHFRNTFSALFDKLIEGMISGDFKNFTPVQRSHFSTRKKQLGAEMMILTGNKKDGITLASNTLQMATANGQMDIALSLSRQLYQHYSDIEPSAAKKSFYKNKVDHFEKTYWEELGIEKLLNELNYCTHMGSDISEVADQLKAFKVGEYWRYNLNYFTARVMVALHQNDGEGVLKICREAIGAFEKETVYMPYIVRWIFHLYQIPVLISMGRYALAESAFNKCIVLPSAGEYNWNLTLYFKALIGFYSNKPKLSLQAYRTVMNTRQKADMKTVDERWYVVKAYLKLYEKLGLVNLDEPFKLYKFLNSVEVANRDKPGQNVAIIIAHLLHLLADIKGARDKGGTDTARRKMNAYMRKADTLDSYITSHLSANKHSRSRIILKMFKQIDNADYYRLRTSKRVGSYLYKLKALQPSINIDTEAELVPFEQSWEMALQLLR